MDVGAGTAAAAASDPPVGRCAGHPARPAHDGCPTCGRPRCSADAHDLADRCQVCAVRPVSVRPVPVALVAAAAVGTVAAVVGAAVGQEYVGAKYFSWGFPALVGILVAVLAAAVVGPMAAATRRLVGATCATYAGISALLDFRFTHEPYGPAGRWLPPLVAAVVAGYVATELFARRPPAVVPPARTGRPSR